MIEVEEIPVLEKELLSKEINEEIVIIVVMKMVLIPTEIIAVMVRTLILFLTIHLLPITDN
jgi:hypothetical protein